MSCGCGGGGGGAPPYHPSDSYHWQRTGGGPSTEPPLPTRDEAVALERDPAPPAQPDRASSSAAGAGFPWGLALVVLVAFALLRRAG